MDYKKIYNDLMISRLNIKLDRLKEKKDGVYFEGHHIIPKCKGGSGNSNRPKNNPNIVLLTPREHFLAHWMLWRIYGDRQMALAFHKMMSTTDKTKRIKSSRAYSEAREAYRLTNIGNQYGKGKTRIVSEEQKIKQSNLMKGRFVGELNPSKRQEVRNKISKKLKGLKKSEEHIKKMSENGKIKKECPHCKKFFDKRNANKWHFDKCLLNPNGSTREQTNFKQGNTYGCKKILDVENNQIYQSVKEAAKKFKVSTATITRWLKKGLKVKYYLE
jgi:hypothetical protein